jgi:hypothetical protein
MRLRSLAISSKEPFAADIASAFGEKDEKNALKARINIENLQGIAEPGDAGEA